MCLKKSHKLYSRRIFMVTFRLIIMQNKIIKKYDITNITYTYSSATYVKHTKFKAN